MKTVKHAVPCPNPDCSSYGFIPEAPSHGTVIKYGHAQTGRQRYQCRTCGHTFTETVGTIFYRRRIPDEEIVSALSQLAEGSRLSSVARSTGHKIETVSAWLKAAGAQAESLEQWLLEDYQIDQGQIDGLWSFVGHKGEKKWVHRNGRAGAIFSHHDS